MKQVRESSKHKKTMAEEASAPCVIFFGQVTLLICLISCLQWRPRDDTITSPATVHLALALNGSTPPPVPHSLHCHSARSLSHLSCLMALLRLDIGNELIWSVSGFMRSFGKE